MDDKNEKLDQLRNFTFGVQSAMFAAIGAFIRTHPDPSALIQMMETYKQREQAYLENKDVPEHVLDSFHQAWARFDIEVQQVKKDGLPQTQYPV